VSVHHLFNLSLVFVLQHFHNSLLVIFRFLLVLVAPLLKLLDCQFEFLLRLNEVFFVVVFLSLKEKHLSFPESFISVVVALKVLEFSLSFLQ